MAHHKYTVVVQAPGHQEKRYRIMASSPSDAKHQVEYAAGELPRGAYVTVVPVSMRGRRGQSLMPGPFGNPSPVHHSIGYPTKAQAEKAKRALEARGGGPYRLSHEGSVVPGREKLGWWYVVGPKTTNPKYGAGRKVPFTSRIRGREFEARDYEHAKEKVKRLAQQTGKDYYVWDHPEKNPTAGVEAIPSRWTPATVTARGKQVQIRIGGRR